MYCKRQLLARAFDIVKVDCNGKAAVTPNRWVQLMAVILPTKSAAQIELLMKVMDINGDSYICECLLQHTGVSVLIIMTLHTVGSLVKDCLMRNHLMRNTFLKTNFVLNFDSKSRKKERKKDQQVVSFVLFYFFLLLLLASRQMKVDKFVRFTACVADS